MVEECRKGPPGAHVAQIDHRDASPAEVRLRRGDEMFSVLGTA
jgi:hypothetical protein